MGPSSGEASICSGYFSRKSRPISETMRPDSAISIAGARRSAHGSRPKRACARASVATEAGAVIARGPTSDWPSRAARARERFTRSGARRGERKATSSPAALWTIIHVCPPRPEFPGAAAPRAKAPATAASTALPPASRIEAAARDAGSESEETAPYAERAPIGASGVPFWPGPSGLAPKPGAAERSTRRNARSAGAKAARRRERGRCERITYKESLIRSMCQPAPDLTLGPARQDRGGARAPRTLTGLDASEPGW